ncbi:hypothetical protein EIP86_003457 [Pleurotus ostreatoroseus]|nr:hypothetical protein EIP86_003457 [Pleurotus ostreatoroseus]
MDTQGAIIPTHIATYQFPSLEKGTSSTGAWNPITISHSAGLARQHDPQSFKPDPKLTVINFNRLYYGPTDAIRISCYVQLATFLSALELYRTQKASRGPLVLPWNAWGPAHTRCFDDSRLDPSQTLSRTAYGSRIYEHSCVRDFNQREIARDLGTRPSHSIRSVPNNIRFISHLPFGSSGRDSNAMPKEDRKVHGYPGRIVLRPTVISAGNVFVEDVITSLPYRETEITWEDETPRVVLGGEIWVGGFLRKNTQRSDPFMRPEPEVSTMKIGNVRLQSQTVSAPDGQNFLVKENRDV